ncbi:YfcL family protein [Pokkaliibacter sp. CJK22405]|uniref:YfcL family protein n=1 Tax=Pokkaliibacter sp. CJK22405 TaxID=3384615 RepID=UPI003984CDBB
MSEYYVFGEAAEEQLRSMEHNAPDDALYAYSYLLGHVSLILADEGDSKEEFKARMDEALDASLAVDRLSEDDKTQILGLWQQVQKAA